MTSCLSVRNWEQFQHYRDRDPLWIKVYGRLLDDADFLALPEAAQAQLVKLWLLASRCRNQIRDDATFLGHALHTRKLYIDLLITRGFVERVASNVLAKPEQVASPHARPRTRGETETETETEQSSSATGARDVRDLFLVAMPDAKRLGWSATLAGWEQGQGTPGGKAIDPAHIDAGLAEYLANETAPTFAPRHVIRYVEGVAKRLPHEPAPRRRETGSFLDLIKAEGSDAVA